MAEIIKSYKGFNKDMTCRGFQYEEETADACHSGFHACEYPLDCFNYYSPNESVYHEVEQSGEFPMIPKVLRLHGDTKEKQWVSLVPILFLLNGNTLAVKWMTDMTKQSRKHGSLSVRRCFG